MIMILNIFLDSCVQYLTTTSNGNQSALHIVENSQDTTNVQRFDDLTGLIVPNNNRNHQPNNSGKSKKEIKSSPHQTILTIEEKALSDNFFIFDRSSTMK